jgi:non-canonical purine NTP pyrophosphatase (RdgB/HAM1 family)
MSRIYFITTAEYKYRAFCSCVKIPGVSFEKRAIETPEIQALTASEVALFSAKYMAHQLSHPVICEDVTHHINSLGGFPGVTLKYVETQIGSEGFLKLLVGKDRRSYFDLAVAYADPEGRSAVFHVEQHGHITDAPAGGGFVMDSIFIVDGTHETISTRIAAGLHQRPTSHYEALMTYLATLPNTSYN